MDCVHVFPLQSCQHDAHHLDLAVRAFVYPPVRSPSLTGARGTYPRSTAEIFPRFHRLRLHRLGHYDDAQLHHQGDNREEYEHVQRVHHQGHEHRQLRFLDDSLDPVLALCHYREAIAMRADVHLWQSPHLQDP